MGCEKIAGDYDPQTRKFVFKTLVTSSQKLSSLSTYWSILSADGNTLTGTRARSPNTYLNSSLFKSDKDEHWEATKMLFE